MQKGISMILAILLLLSSSGLTYAQHFCLGREMMNDVTLGEKHLSCGMEIQTTGCEDTDHHPEKRKGCCDNKYTQVDTDDHFAKADFQIDFQKNFILAYTAGFILKTVDNYPSNTHFFIDYSPPPLSPDIQVEHQVFLI